MLRASFILVLLVVITCGGTIVYLGLPTSKASSHQVSFLEAAVRVAWDRADIPWVHAENWKDAYAIQGYLSARERFFQMELTRRKMAGKLSELFGPKALNSDIQYRNWNFSRAAREGFASMPAEAQKRFIAYAQGVNTFLEKNRKPWELLVLNAPLVPWTPEDSFLVVLSMYDNLNRHTDTLEEAMTVLKKQLTPRALSFFIADGGFLDAPIVPDPTPLTLPLPPTSKEVDLKSPRKNIFPKSPKDFEPGSNAWAISGKLTASGYPLLAGDPHLDLRVPNLWYRMGLAVPDHSVYGVSIPGIPGIVIGRNEHVAWSFTNAAVDNSDRIVLPSHSSLLSSRTETVQVKGHSPREVVFQDSPWGPIIFQEGSMATAAQWTALDPNNLKNLDLSALNSARDTTELLEAFGNWAGPPQNAVFATRSGDIGWTIAGKVPKRSGFDGTTVRSASTHKIWEGYIPSSHFPKVINPPTGFIVSANQRTVPLEARWLPFGSHWPNPARAKRIADLLNQGTSWSATECFSVQLDNMSLTHLWYRDQLIQCSDVTAAVPSNQSWLLAALPTLQQWDGRTQRDSSAYPILKHFRFRLQEQLLTPIAEALADQRTDDIFKLINTDSLMRRLLVTQPAHLLPPRFRNYCDLMQTALVEALKELADSPKQIGELRWGPLNKSQIQHPFSKILPTWVQPLLDMPQVSLAGDTLVPNVMTPHNGASMRMVIDLSDPAQSIFSQPGGQSGHVFSTHYKEFFNSWAQGSPVPFEAGPLSTTEFFYPTN